MMTHVTDGDGGMSGGGAVIDLGSGNSIVIANHNAAWFIASDFVFF
jgi:hypothetical protein